MYDWKTFYKTFGIPRNWTLTSQRTVSCYNYHTQSSTPTAILTKKLNLFLRMHTHHWMASPQVLLLCDQNPSSAVASTWSENSMRLKCNGVHRLLRMMKRSNVVPIKPEGGAGIVVLLYYHCWKRGKTWPLKIVATSMDCNGSLRIYSGHVNSMVCN